MILTDRYRIIGLLGRGGMGEVYRADDLKLGQPVALKFLPRALASDPVRRERFFAEVRITRQLSHPNICRVYDIAEFDGQHFLSMEYIDGEDLASLIQRVGYLPNEKALEIARQLAAGLAAAHDRGVLHRDLKPANIMIDGHGRARITDFGIAVAAGDDAQTTTIAGTPAYMAPEQFAGKGASVRSDIYALGLILYEALSGRRAFTAASIAELRDEKERLTLTAPSKIRDGIDLVAERLVMRCLERDPSLRPSSAVQLAAALPGGDPLAAAIAAGETPSPEMVAASGQKEGIHPAVALALVACVVVGAVASIIMARSASVLERVGPGKPPEVLAERAREFLAKAGYSEDPADRAFGFNTDTNNVRLLNYIQEMKDAARWDRSGAFNPVIFWYRESAEPLHHVSAFAIGLGPARVTASDPPMRPRDVLVQLDSDGRLRGFEAMVEPSGIPLTPASPPDWAVLFSEAGFDLSHWTPTNPESVFAPYADTRAAWQGSLPRAPDIPIRIEAAAYGGKPVYFEVTGPWPKRVEPVPFLQSAPLWATIIALGLFYGVIAGALFLARQNLRSGRGDRRGAARLTFVFVFLLVLSWLLGEHHIWAGSGEWNLLYMFLGRTLVQAGLLWAFYIAVEPLVRRRWPQVLITWTRVLAGNFRDPQVGRDVLIGCADAMALTCASRLQNLILVRRGTAALVTPDLNQVLRTGIFVSGVFGGLAFIMLVATLGFLLFVFLLRFAVRNDWLAIIIVAVLFTTTNTLANQLPWTMWPIVLAGNILVLFVLVRFGLVAFLSGALPLVLFLWVAPMVLQTSAWYFGYGAAAILIVAALTFYGFHTSLGGRRLFDISTVGR
jgi:hypothetical protein